MEDTFNNIIAWNHLTFFFFLLSFNYTGELLSSDFVTSSSDLFAVFFFKLLDGTGLNTSPFTTAPGWPLFTGKADLFFLYITTCCLISFECLKVYINPYQPGPSLSKTTVRFELSDRFNPLFACTDGGKLSATLQFKHMQFKKASGCREIKINSLFSLLQIGSTVLASSLQIWLKPTSLPLAARRLFSCVGHHLWFSLRACPTWTNSAILRAVHLLINSDVISYLSVSKFVQGQLVCNCAVFLIFVCVFNCLM